MDPSTRLDHAVFQLTPTRTRCDLLVCSSSGKGGVYEKIASGLLEPFLSHLSSAREQIPKGGYSFTLRPPPHATRSGAAGGGGAIGIARGDDAAAATATTAPAGSTPTATTTAPPDWFTKGTLERFVRFVNTPDILERVAAIEKEIAHIESCTNNIIHHPEDDPAATTSTATIHVATAGGTARAENDHQGTASSLGTGDDSGTKSSPPYKVKADDAINGHDATTHGGENSRLCLQHTLETRKAVLLKEQGMAYARATVAGYDMASVDDLVSFAVAFGASRLREACTNFKDICEKKERDKIWMDELAAIEAFHRQTCNHPLAHQTLEVVTGHHPELNGTASDTATDPNIAPASSDAGLQDNNSKTPNREPWGSANNGVYHENYQIPIGWSGHPPYVYNILPNPPHQQMPPPYQGYALPAGAFPAYPPAQYLDNPPQQPPPSKEVPDGGAVAGDASYSGQRYHMSTSGSNNGTKPGKKKAAGRSTTTSGSRNGVRSHDSSRSAGSSESADHGETHSTTTDASEEEEEEEEEGRHAKGRHHKRYSNGKKSSRRVVIRNINYISSERRDGEDGSTTTGGSSVEGDIVEDIVDSLKKYHKTSHHQHKIRKGKKNRDHGKYNNVEGDRDDSLDRINADVDADSKARGARAGDHESWHAFQSILMRDGPPSPDQLHGKEDIRRGDGNEQEQHHVYYSRGEEDDGCEIKNGTGLSATSSVHGFPVETDQSLKGTRRRPNSRTTVDPVAAHDRDVDHDGYDNKRCSQNILEHCEEDSRTRMKRSHHNAVDGELLLLPERTRSEKIVAPGDGTAYAGEISTLAPNYLRGDADYFVISGKSGSFQLDGEHAAGYSLMFEGEQNLKSSGGGVGNNNNNNNQKVRNELPDVVDDSFIVAAMRSTAAEEERPISHWGDTDMSIISGLAFEAEGGGVASHSTGNGSLPDNSHEPDDLQMVLAERRDTGSEKPVGASTWDIPEILDYTVDHATFHAARGSDSIHEANGSTEPPNPNGASGAEGNPRDKLLIPAKDARSNKSANRSLQTKVKPVVPSRSRKPSAMSREEIQRNKMLKEEENRRRMEALLVQRQKRIAERSSGGAAPPPAVTTARVLSSACSSEISKPAGGSGGSSRSQEKRVAPRPAAVLGSSNRPTEDLLHRTEPASSSADGTSHAPDGRYKKNGKATAVAT